MANLTDPWFEAKFYGYINAETGAFRITHEDGRPISFAEAQGIELWCPCGYGKRDSNGDELYPLDLSLGKGRPHGLMVPFANPPSGIPCPPNHGPLSRDRKTRPRWTVSGTGLSDLSTHPSIAVNDPECWHGHITNGAVV